MHYPHNPLQPGPMYFKTARKCAVFGVCCEGVSHQVNYLIDKASDTGKGANTVISLLHHFLQHHSLGEVKLGLHPDNCAGQKKNNIVLQVNLLTVPIHVHVYMTSIVYAYTCGFDICVVHALITEPHVYTCTCPCTCNFDNNTSSYSLQYLAWRVLAGLHQSITMSFVLVGHTKFSPDWCFGLFQQRYRKTFVSSLQDIAEVVESSADVNVPQLVGTQSGEPVVPIYLQHHFRKVPHMKSFHHFHFDAQHKGMVTMKQYSDSDETTFNILVDDDWCADVGELPTTILPLASLPLGNGACMNRYGNTVKRVQRTLHVQSRQRMTTQHHLQSERGSVANVVAGVTHAQPVLT